MTVRTIRPDILFLCGLPATGKSRFSRYLHDNHGFARYELECFPKGWAVPDLQPIWSTSRNEFVDEIRKRHQRASIEWGFPPSRLVWALELRDAGAEPFWFDGDKARLREVFLKRGGLDIRSFDNQVKAIQESRPNDSLSARVVNVLHDDGSFRSMSEIWSDVFTDRSLMSPD